MKERRTVTGRMVSGLGCRLDILQMPQYPRVLGTPDPDPTFLQNNLRRDLDLKKTLE